MDRRSFLGTMIGGISATAAVRTWPFRVYSFPPEITTTLPASAIRFVRMYDVMHDRFISRLDVLYGFDHELFLPSAAEAAYSVTSKNGLALSQEDLHAFAVRHSQGKFPVKLIESKIPKDGNQWIQRGWDISS